MKADALGEEHEVWRLERILDEPLLGKWRHRAEETKSKGLFFDYSLHNMRIQRVRHATVSLACELFQKIASDV